MINNSGTITSLEKIDDTTLARLFFNLNISNVNENKVMKIIIKILATNNKLGLLTNGGLKQ